MINEVKLVKIGLTMETGKIVKWHKAVGEQVRDGEAFFDVETDKAVQTVESLHTGYLKKILVEEGQEVPVNTLLALIGDREDEVD